jgi:hypothetical protein
MSLDHKIFSASGRSPSAHPSHPSASDHQNRRRPPPGPDRLPIPGRRAPVRRGHHPRLLVTCGGTLCSATAFTRSRRCRPRSPIYIPAPSLSAGAHQAPAVLPPFPLHPLLPRGAHALRPPKSQGNLSTIPAVDTSIRPGRARNNQSIGQRISRREEESRSPTSAARVGGPLRLRLCPAAPSFVVLALRRGSRIRDEEKEGEAFIGLRCVCRTARRRR